MTTLFVRQAVWDSGDGGVFERLDGGGRGAVRGFGGAYVTDCRAAGGGWSWSVGCAWGFGECFTVSWVGLVDVCAYGAMS